MPITWKNIDAPDFKNSMWGTALAGASFDKAGDSLTGLLDKHNTIQEGNWTNQAGINTDILLARAKEANDLNAFNAQKGNYDPAALMPEMGRQFDKTQLQTGLKDQEKLLQDAAYNASAQQGTHTFNQTQSPGQSLMAVEAEMNARGITDPQVRASFLAQATAAMNAGPGAHLKERQDSDQAQYLQQIHQGKSPTGTNNVSQPQGQLSFTDADQFVQKVEGGYNPSDGGSGVPVNHGVNGAAHPNVDIKNLTAEKAVGIRKPYWDAVKGDSLPPQAAMIAYDAAINHGPGFAQKMLKETNADPAKMMEYRKAEYQRLGLQEKHTPNVKGWMNRLDQLGEHVGSMGTPQQAQPQVRMTAAMAKERLAAQDTQTERTNTATDRSRKDAAYTRQEAIKADSTAVMEHYKKTGNEAEALALVNGKDHQNEVRMQFTGFLEAAAKPLPTQIPVVETALSTIQSMLKHTSDVQQVAVQDATQVTNMLDYHKDSKLLTEANTTQGGVVELLRNGTDKAGFWASILPGSNVALNNEVTEFLVKKAQDLSTKGAPKELVNRVILGTIQRMGGKTQALSGNMSFNKKNFNAQFSESLRQEMLHGKAIGEQKSLETKKVNIDAENISTLSSLQNEIKSALTLANASNTEFTIPPETQKKIDEYNALIEARNSKDAPATKPVKTTEAKGVSHYGLSDKQVDELLGMAGGATNDTKEKEDQLRTAASKFGWSSY